MNNEEPLQEEVFEERLRAELTAELEAAKAAIEQAIARLSTLPDGVIVDEQIDALRAQLSQLDAQSAAVATGTASQLLELSPSVSSLVTSSNLQISQTQQFASVGIAQATMEMSNEQLATYFNGLRAANDKANGEFGTYARVSIADITELAKQNGTNINEFEKRQEQIDALRAQAVANGDRVEVFRLDALSAGNIMDGLDMVGASEEKKAEAKTQLEQTRQSYLQEREMAAIEQARALGLKGQALANYVAADQVEARAALEKDAVNYLGDSVVMVENQRNTVNRLEAEEKGAQSQSSLGDAGTDLPPEVIKQVELESFANLGLVAEAEDVDVVPPATPVVAAQASHMR